jgi:hypothetical protein
LLGCDVSCSARDIEDGRSLSQRGRGVLGIAVLLDCAQGRLAGETEGGALNLRDTINKMRAAEIVIATTSPTTRSVLPFHHGRFEELVP